MRETIIQALEISINAVLNNFDPACSPEDIPVNLEATKDQKHGDLASNIAFLLGKRLKRKPMEIAQSIVDQIQIESNVVERISIAPPGFINFFLSSQYWQQVIK